MNTYEQIPNAQAQFINKVDEDHVKVQRQVPQSRWRGDETVDISQNSVQRQNGGYQLCNGEQMPQEQFHRVKQNQNPSPESSEKDRDSTVTARTGNDAIRNQTHEGWKDF